MSDAKIPVIDIAPLRSHRTEGTKIVAEQIGKACREIGFFYISNHGVPTTVIDATFAKAREFFALPLEDKQKLSMQENSRCFRGYAPVLSELADGKRNSYELMEFSVDFDENHPDVMAGRPMHGPNLWPDLPGYKQAMTTYIDEMVSLGFDLMRAIAISLNLEDDFFQEAFQNRSFWQFRTTHYPSADDVKKLSSKTPLDGPVADIEIGDYNCGAHTDYGCLTILLANNPGLQIRDSDGNWIEAPAIPGAYICNIGDMLQYWTNDLYKATMHRVLTTGPRISLPFFFQPNYDTIVKPVHMSSTESKAEPGLVYGPYAFQKYQGIYPNCRVN